MLPGLDFRALFAAGLFPVILAALFLLIPSFLLSQRYGWVGPVTEKRPPLKDSFIEALPALFAPVIILGGLRSGLFTPTEAAVVAVTYGLVIGIFVYRSLSLSDLYFLFRESAKISGVVLLIIALAGIVAWTGTTLGTFTKMAEFILGISDNLWGLLLLAMFFV